MSGSVTPLPAGPPVASVASVPAGSPVPAPRLPAPSRTDSDRPSGSPGWAELIGAYRSDLIRVARMRMRQDVSGSDAEDVVHEVFLRVVRRGPDPREVNRPAAYLRQAVANECVTRWRRAREWAVEDTPDRIERDHAEPCVVGLTVHQALDALTPRQRSVIVLGFLRGHTDAEVADELGIQPVTVRTLRRRGLERMRVALGGQDPKSMIRSGVSRRMTRTVPSGSTSYGRPRYFSDSVSMSSRPPSSEMVTRPRISA